MQNKSTRKTRQTGKKPKHRKPRESPKKTNRRTNHQDPKPKKNPSPGGQREFNEQFKVSRKERRELQYLRQDPPGKPAQNPPPQEAQTTERERVTATEKSRSAASLRVSLADYSER